MNGTILGMKKREIDAKFDEIIDFSGVEQFLDTPIKRYSSGMTVRLAFAVAAHLEPQIMIIDEVLAVGDVQFQKKCLGKIGQVANTGRTVIFVSHSMSAMEALTRSCLVLGEGRLTYAGPTQEAVQQYLKESQVQIASSNDVRNRPRPSYPMDQKIIFTELVFDHFIPTFDSNETIRILAKLYAKEQVSGFRFSGTVFQSSGAPVGSFFSPCQLSIEANEEAQFVVELADNHLAPGRYHFGLAVGAGNVSAGHRDSDILLEVLPFNINHPAGEAGTMGQWPSAWGAVIFQEPTVRRV
jgi:lipopolysaccharide transport system ATP-binding protein